MGGLEPPRSRFVVVSDFAPALAAIPRSAGLDRGLADLETARKLIFGSRGALIASPTRHHPNFDERRPEYTLPARAAARPVVIVDARRFRGAAGVVGERRGAVGAACRKTVKRRHRASHGLSRRVPPEDLRRPGVPEGRPSEAGWRQGVCRR